MSAPLSILKKILVIDADVEAPGLTWMLEEQGNGSISYLDILSVMNFNQIAEDTIDKLAEQVRLSTIAVSTDLMEGDQYFIPVYRNRNQVMDIFSSPERILLTQDNKFFITEIISKLGAAVGAELVFVDLRAGITEYSAPFLFDSRVEKFYVTSTSLQSIKGLNQILEQIYGKTKSDLLDSQIFMTMIPQTMTAEQVYEIENQILKNVEDVTDTETSTFLREDYIKNFKFEDALIHIDKFSSLCNVLQGKDVTKTMKKVAEGIFTLEDKDSFTFSESEVRVIQEKICSIASSIKEIAKNFKSVLPRLVISGAKGSGKTYIYKQLLAARTWGNFECL